ncbi:MAG: hypothetical protein K2J67_10425 [Lachnospiraceae bacterium]|nr:hypothetical protein [Lachnospiraceae bacterium]
MKRKLFIIREIGDFCILAQLPIGVMAPAVNLIAWNRRSYHICSLPYFISQSFANALMA